MGHCLCSHGLVIRLTSEIKYDCLLACDFFVNHFSKITKMWSHFLIGNMENNSNGSNFGRYKRKRSNIFNYKYLHQIRNKHVYIIQYLIFQLVTQNEAFPYWIHNILLKHPKMYEQNCNYSEEILRKSKEATEALFPTKSGDRYKKEFHVFNEWKSLNNVKKVDEEVMLAYLLDLSKKYSSASLWPKYSVVKSMLVVHENIDIFRFGKIKAFLKKQSVDYQPTQAKTLTREELNRFPREAPDRIFFNKGAAMIGVTGGCRREELHEMFL